MALDLTDRLLCSCPYPMPTMNASWRTSTVVAMASGIREEGAWDRLPILADALQDAGCDDPDILHHLRGGVVPTPCTCKVVSRVPWGRCLKCRGASTRRVSRPPVPHGNGKFPNRNGGCWEGTCWVVQEILQLPQRVAAKYQIEGTPAEDYRYAPVVNPGDAEGKAWLVVPAVMMEPPEYVTESKYVTGAEDPLIDDELGKDYRISEEDLKDYQTSPGRGGENPEPPEYRCGWTDGGNHPYDEELMHVYGDETARVPWACAYIGPGIPPEGIDPTHYRRHEWECVVCSKRFYLSPEASEQVCSPTCLKKHDEMLADVESEAAPG